MIKFFTVFVLFVFFLTGALKSQEIPLMKLSDNAGILKAIDEPKGESDNLINPSLSKNESSTKQLKTRKAVNMYVGAGYSFVIFTASDMNTAYPVFDTRSGDFLSEVNLYFGFAVAKAVTFEFEPSILFTHNNRNPTIYLSEAINVYGTPYNYVFPQTLSMIAFPLTVNGRFFPLFNTKGFGRLFFVGGGVGVVWVREEYDNIYSNDPGGIYYGDYSPIITESTSQWQPLFRIMTGFTGTGGAFGFGGEIRYNFVPLKKSNLPFATRIASNFNSVDIALRFYFSL